MKINSITKALFLTFTFLISTCVVASTSEKKEKKRPNIIVFLVDDMGLMDTSVPFVTDASGKLVKYPLNDFYRTPNMVKLAKQGVRFTNFYAHSVCSPTRASILTGQNSARHRTTNWIKTEENNKGEFGPSEWNWKGVKKGEITLPLLLQQAGYRTIHVGKAHFGPAGSDAENPKNIGFDVNIGGNSIGHPGSYYGKDGFGKIRRNKARAVPDLEKYHGQDIFLTEALTIEAKTTITKAKEEGKPFFLNLAHYAVHSPYQSDKRYAKNYENSGKNKDAQAYATLIEGMDKSLGDIVKHVKDLGLGENTIILLLGDNGSTAPLPIINDYSSSAPFKGKKGKHWEGGMRVPFIASWISPNKNSSFQKKTPIAQNTVHEQLGKITDILPTICNIANIKIPENYPIDGFNLSKQLNNEKNESRKEVFLNHFPHEHRSSYFTSLVSLDWKVIYHYQIKGAPEYELFNLKKDPFEAINLADENPEQLKRMLASLVKELENKNALYPERNHQPIKIIIPN